MTVTFTTRIENLERTTADGKVTVVHWSIHGTDGTYSSRGDEHHPTCNHCLCRCCDRGAH